ncbi:MAG: hypothetical protein RBT71_13685 [Flavobacteriales bacterium]|nr:hypothetical protein [Flavobacteriales bacterium]
MRTSSNILLIGLVGMALLAGCRKGDDPERPAPPVHEEEVITDIHVRFTDDAGGTYEWHASMDGGFHHDHGDGDDHDHTDGELHIHGDTLPADAHLHAEIILLNRSVTPTDTVSHEVRDEGEAHQFFFIAEEVDITFTYGDTDGNGRPIGLVGEWQTGAPGTGEVKVVLRHGLDKGAPGVSEGLVANAGGATDLEVHFPAVVH